LKSATAVRQGPTAIASRFSVSLTKTRVRQRAM
jgi:hypothetical protein